MFRIDVPSAAASLPSPSAAGTPGYFTGGNPGVGTPATVVSADWLNLVQEELLSVLTAASVTPSKTTRNQLLTSINTLIAANSPSSLIGTGTNISLSIGSASATGTITADEIVLGASLGGAVSKISNYSQAINLATTGAGGMDTGSAPVNGFIAIYATVKADGTKGVVCCNVSSSVSPTYTGANPVAGVIATALIGIVPTDGSSLMKAGKLTGREFSYNTPVSIFSAQNGQASLTSQSVSAAVPAAAKKCSGYLDAPTTNYSGSSIAVAANASGLAIQQGGYVLGVVSLYRQTVNFINLVMTTSQTIFWRSGDTTATASNLSVNGYAF
jgi:hypothetical protein